MFTTFQDAGFTEEQAFQLTRDAFQNSMENNE